MFRYVYFSLTIILVIYPSYSHFSSIEFATLISKLKVGFHSECLFLMNSGFFGAGLDLVESVKTLSKQGIVVGNLMAVDTLKQSMQEFRCNGNRPIYAMSADQRTTPLIRLMHEIPCYPKWIIFLESNQSLNEFFKNIYVPFNCEVLVAQSFGSDIRLTEVYQVAAGWPLKTPHFGTWSLDTGLRTPHDDSLYRRRNQLDGLSLKVVTCNYSPESKIFKNKSGDLCVGGFFGSVWSVLETELNFTTSVYEEGNTNFGSYLNGSWTGMVGILDRKEADAGVSGFSYDGERMEAVDFLSPLLIGRVHLFIKKPETMRFQWTAFLTPFTAKLWLMIIGSIIISSILITYSYQVGLRHGIERQRLLENNYFSLLGSMFCVSGIYCSQGPSSTPRNNSCRLILLAVGISSTVILAAYSGSLTSFIAVLQLALPYETAEEYIDDRSYELGMPPNAVWVHLHNPKNPLFKKLNEIMFPTRHMQPLDRWVGFQKLCSSEKPYAWFASKLFDQGLLESLDCEVSIVPGPLVEDTLSIVVTKGSPYTHLFNHKIKSLRTSGVLERMIRQFWPEPIVNAESALPKVELYHVVPIFVVLAVGGLVSLIIVAGEMRAPRNGSEVLYEHQPPRKWSR